MKSSYFMCGPNTDARKYVTGREVVPTRTVAGVLLSAPAERVCMYDRILVPTDGSDPADRAFEQALDLAATYDAALHLLYVVDVSSLAGEFDAVTVIEQLEKSGRKTVQRLRKRAEEV